MPPEVLPPARRTIQPAAATGAPVPGSSLKASSSKDFRRMGESRSKLWLDQAEPRSAESPGSVRLPGWRRSPLRVGGNLSAAKNEKTKWEGRPPPGGIRGGYLHTRNRWNRRSAERQATRAEAPLLPARTSPVRWKLASARDRKRQAKARPGTAPRLPCSRLGGVPWRAEPECSRQWLRGESASGACRLYVIRVT